VGDPDPGFWRGKAVVVTGGAGFLGSVVVRDLEALGADVRIVRSAEHDLRLPDQTRAAVDGAELVVHLAANVGGIGFNRRNPAPLVHDNMAMTSNIFEQSRQAGVAKLVSACTVCAYPKHVDAPFKEDDLWDGYPEETNAPYGLAKKMMLAQSQAYREQYGMNSVVVFPVNLYGPRDNFHLRSSHVIPAMIRKCVTAHAAGLPEVELWGDGTPTREFLYVEDAAEGILLAAERYDSSDPVNLGSGEEISIRDLADLIARATGFEGRFVWDTSKPNGQPRRRLDVTRAKERFGFEAKTPFSQGIPRTVAYYQKHREEIENRP